MFIKKHVHNRPPFIIDRVHNRPNTLQTRSCPSKFTTDHVHTGLNHDRPYSSETTMFITDRIHNRPHL